MQISVIIPAYNAELTLAEAVKSALSQGPNIEEVIVIVNGCTDNTMAVANSLSKEDSRVIVVTSVLLCLYHGASVPDPTL